MAGSQNALGRFFGGLLKVYRFIRSVFLNLILLFIVLGFIGAMLGSPPAPIGDDSVLLLNPRGTIVEQRTFSDPLALLSSSGNGLSANNQVLLQDLLDAIAAAKDDSRITSMIISTDQLSGVGLSQLFDLGAAITDFKTAGKKVYATGDNFNQGQYLLASYADEIILNSVGGVSLEGFGIFQNYFQESLSKLGVNVHIFRVGTYKSAVEPYMRADMSPESRANYTHLLGDLWGHFTQELETRRNLTTGTINDYVNKYDEHLTEYQGDSAELALALKLVDRIDTRHGAIDYLQEAVGSKEEKLRSIGFEQYLRSDIPTPDKAGGHIALIVAEGEIVDGEAPAGTIGGDSLANLIHSQIDDKNIKALVLRVNSPGGSAFASEVIRTELEAFKTTGRPIVVSMGDTAASGGYWIATIANQIWASPMTITGSIGIFAVVPTFEETAKKLGIGTDGIGSTALAGTGTVGMPLSDLASRSIQLSIENGYDRFINLVAKARDKDPQQVDAIAQGQVWSGISAKANGLVDELGNLDQAVAAAASLAKLERYQVDLQEAELSPTQRMLRDILQNTKVQSWLQPVLSSLLPNSSLTSALQSIESQLGWIARANDPDYRYVRCVECTAVKL
jgi:protease IV